MKHSKWVVGMAIWMLPWVSQAGGFLLYEHNSAGMGMAGARVGFADDPSAVYFNPAAIIELPRLQIQAGVTGVLPLIQYDAAGRPDSPRTYVSRDTSGNQVDKIVNDGENDADARTKIFTPIHLYATYRVGKSPFSVGFGLNNPFGLGVYWPKQWDGKYVATETELRTFFSNPLVAVDLAELLGLKEAVHLSVAAGYNLVVGQAHLAKAIDLRAAELMQQDGGIQDPRAAMALDGLAVGHGWNAAIFAEVPGLFSWGFSWRSGVRLPFSGDAEFRFDEAGELARERLSGSVVFPDKTTGMVDINLPHHFNTGLALELSPRLSVGLAYYMAFFSSYDELAIGFECTDEGTCPGLEPDPIEKNWGSTWQASLGAEYVWDDTVPLRVGYGYATSPVPEKTYDPSLPDGDRNFFGIGGGYRGDGWKVDAAYMFAFWRGDKANDVGRGTLENPEGRADGVYRTQSHLLSVTVTGEF